MKKKQTNKQSLDKKTAEMNKHLLKRINYLSLNTKIEK